MTRCTRTRAAVEEGVVAGGGVALLYAVRSLDKVKFDNNDQKVGIDIIRRAILTPARLIAENAGVDGAVISGKLLESKNTNWGYDAQSGEFVDMVKAGIIDPDQGRALRPAGCGFGRRPADHHRGDDRRAS